MNRKGLVQLLMCVLGTRLSVGQPFSSRSQFCCDGGLTPASAIQAAYRLASSDSARIKLYRFSDRRQDMEPRIGGSDRPFAPQSLNTFRSCRSPGALHSISARRAARPSIFGMVIGVPSSAGTPRRSGKVFRSRSLTLGPCRLPGNSPAALRDGTVFLRLARPTSSRDVVAGKLSFVVAYHLSRRCEFDRYRDQSMVNGGVEQGHLRLSLRRILAI